MKKTRTKKSQLILNNEISKLKELKLKLNEISTDLTKTQKQVSVEKVKLESLYEHLKAKYENDKESIQEITKEFDLRLLNK